MRTDTIIILTYARKKDEDPERSEKMLECAEALNQAGYKVVIAARDFRLSYKKRLEKAKEQYLLTDVVLESLYQSLSEDATNGLAVSDCSEEENLRLSKAGFQSITDVSNKVSKKGITYERDLKYTDDDQLIRKEYYRLGTNDIYMISPEGEEDDLPVIIPKKGGAFWKTTSLDRIKMEWIRSLAKKYPNGRVLAMHLSDYKPLIEEVIKGNVRSVIPYLWDTESESDKLISSGGYVFRNSDLYDRILLQNEEMRNIMFNEFGPQPNAEVIPDSAEGWRDLIEKLDQNPCTSLEKDVPVIIENIILEQKISEGEKAELELMITFDDLADDTEPQIIVLLPSYGEERSEEREQPYWCEMQSIREDKNRIRARADFMLPSWHKISDGALRIKTIVGNYSCIYDLRKDNNHDKPE